MLHFLLTETQKCMCQRDIYNGLQPGWERKGIIMRCLAICVKGDRLSLCLPGLALVHILERTVQIEPSNQDILSIFSGTNSKLYPAFALFFLLLTRIRNSQAAYLRDNK